MSVWLFALVGAGGTIGSLVRYGAGRWVTGKGKASFYGTLIVNLAGSFAMGMLIGLGLESVHRAEYAFFGIGVLGGLTTYSTLNVQKATMWQEGKRRTLAFYIGATYLGGWILTAAGVGLGYLLST
ncbi:hypothetical protein SD71_09565 [Cohnella kolymensis]|uniref:Fluoride-specific ion channel FluC n=1 Tax=Cohnella kolymensis TaxID=1590652 RepID=A0ABR5A588_9BACL|nr:CrcB family protein [Cohnella kolymensis]KIL36189.1 hypothetical protein SD71_09565 [Cohnella kolymensis]